MLEFLVYLSLPFLYGFIEALKQDFQKLFISTLQVIVNMAKIYNNSQKLYYDVIIQDLVWQGVAVLPILPVVCILVQAVVSVV